MKQPKLKKEDLLRLVILYALRYEDTQSNELNSFIDALTQAGVSSDDLGVCVVIVELD